MTAVQITSGVIVAFIAILSGIYAFFTSQCKGPILSNSYSLLSKAERAKADKKAEYRFAAVVFSCISVLFAFLALQIFTSWKWPYILIGTLTVFLIVYVIIGAVKTEKK